MDKGGGMLLDHKKNDPMVSSIHNHLVNNSFAMQDIFISLSLGTIPMEELLLYSLGDKNRIGLVEIKIWVSLSCAVYLLRYVC